jgi:hypothetical protein
MTVADLKQHFADLAKLLDASGSKQVAKDFGVIAEGLTPFAGQSLPEFTRFLAQAHEYHTTGKLSAPPKAPRTKAPKTAKTKPNPEEVAVTVRQLYDHSGDLSLTMEQIESGLAPLADLSKEGLLKVAEVMEIFGVKSKRMDVIQSAIRQKILDRRSSAQREEMIRNPPPADAPVVITSDA